MSTRKRVEGARYATDTGFVRITDMDREQLLDVIDDLLAEKERDSQTKLDLFELLDSKPPPQRSVMDRLLGRR